MAWCCQVSAVKLDCAPAGEAPVLSEPVEVWATGVLEKKSSPSSAPTIARTSSLFQRRRLSSRSLAQSPRRYPEAGMRMVDT